jgi:hypothetical protein
VLILIQTAFVQLIAAPRAYLFQPGVMGFVL